MIDIYKIYDELYREHLRYRISALFATSWNFRFMDNLYNFGKDFK